MLEGVGRVVVVGCPTTHKFDLVTRKEVHVTRRQCDIFHLQLFSYAKVVLESLPTLAVVWPKNVIMKLALSAFKI
jgi:hypothetical protein